MQRVQGCRVHECRGVRECRGCQRHRGPGVPGYHWLPLATIDLVGNNREFEV